MITVNSFFSGTLNTVDAVIGNFVNIAYNNFIQANSSVITLMFTLYVMLLGYRFLNHDHHFNLSHVMRHMIVMLIVYGLIMNWDLYNVFVYNIFTNEPGNIAKVLVQSAGQSQSETSITQALDGIYKLVIDASTGLWGQGGFGSTGLAFYLYGALVYLIGTALCVFALLLFIYAKMMMAVALALGPFFISFMLWDTTKDMFAAWLRKLITLALIPIVTSAILVLMLSVINVTLPTVNQPASNIQFYGIVPFLGLSLTTVLILSQVFTICSSLGGGIALRSISKGADIAKSTLSATGATAVGRYMANKAKEKLGGSNNRARRNMPR
jgi:type IV secretion system protein VirB6